MEFEIPNFQPAIAELIVAGAAVILLLLVALFRRGAASLAYWGAQVALLAGAIAAYRTTGEVGFTFGSMYLDDPSSDLLKIIACLSTVVALVYGRRYLAERKLDTAEFYLLTLFSTLGVMVLISAGSLLTVYLGVELMSLPLYALVAIDRDSPRATEAAMKYFVLGALASGLLLYGISMVYGATQSLAIADVARALFEGQANNTVLVFGLVFVVAGIAFKLGAVPFHMWIPDVYHGAPTAVTILISAAPKLAAFAMAFRLLAVSMSDLAEQWQKMLMFVGVASIVLGNIAAIAQTNLKRMLAYSAISHVGFMLLGMMTGVVGSGADRHVMYNAYSSSLFYIITYVLMALGAFGILLLMSRAGFEAENIDDFKGLNKRSSWWAGMMAIVMFSMAGIPFFIGFFAKFYVLQSVVWAGHWWLAVLAIVMSVVGAFYYLRVVKVMFFDEPLDSAPISAGLGMRALLSCNVLAIAVLGIFPGQLMVLCHSVLMRGSL